MLAIQIVSMVRRCGSGLAAIGLMAVGTASATANPVSFMPAPGRSAQATVDIEQGEARIEVSDEWSQAAQDAAAVSVDAPLGKVLIGPGSIKGEQMFERRTKFGGRLTIVEVSATPFAPEVTAAAGKAGTKVAYVPNTQPAGW